MTPTPPLRIDWLTLRFTRRTIDHAAPTERVDDDGVVDPNLDGDRAPSADQLRKVVYQRTLSFIDDTKHDLLLEDGKFTLRGPPEHFGIIGGGLNGELAITDLPVSIRSMHGGIHLTLTGEYWRRFHQPPLYNNLIAAVSDIAASAKTHWQPTHCTASRIDLATEEPFTNFVTRTVRQYQFGDTAHLPTPYSFGDHDIVDAELRVEALRVQSRFAQLSAHRPVTFQHIHSTSGSTWNIGYHGADASRMREKEHFVRVYSKVTLPGIERTVRREVECKDIEGDNLAEQLRNAVAVANILLDTKATGDPTELTAALEHIDGRAKLSLQDYARRIIGMAMTAERRALHDVHDLDQRLVDLCAELVGNNELAVALVRAARKKRTPKS